MTRATVKTLALVSTLAGLAGLGWNFLPARRAPEQPATATHATSPIARPATGMAVTTTVESPSPAPVDTAALADDPRIQQVNTAAELVKYFDELESAARKNGKVTDELARASEAGKRLIPAMGGPNVARKMFEFSDRMRHLSFDLQWGPLQNELASLRTQIAKETNAAAREKLLADYRAKSAKLPPAGQIAAAEQMKKTLEGT